MSSINARRRNNLKVTVNNYDNCLYYFNAMQKKIFKLLNGKKVLGFELKDNDIIVKTENEDIILTKRQLILDD